MNIGPYQAHALDYDRWFTENPLAYAAELRAVQHLLPSVHGLRIEVGAGTGRFAVPLGMHIGIEPCSAMAVLAQERGLQVIRGTAEALPLPDASVELVLMVTVLCFVRDVRLALQEAIRVLHPGGTLLIAMLDQSSPLGQVYEQHKASSLFYRKARFHSAASIASLMQQLGLTRFQFCQTIFTQASKSTAAEPVTEGYGQGLFAVLQGHKQ
jgi:ubiquinone/menaquinone biosynthesis C-methylase UbiE